MRTFLFTITFVTSIIVVNAQEVVAYRIFNSNGVGVEFAKVVEAACNSEIVFFGEQHEYKVPNLNYQWITCIY